MIGVIDPSISREESSQREVSPDLATVNVVFSNIVEDALGNIVGETFLYKQEDNLHVVISSLDEKWIESTYIRLSTNLIPFTKFDEIANSHDYSAKSKFPKSQQDIVIPLEALSKSTHLISAIRATNDENGGRHYDGTIVLTSEIIQSIIN